MASASTCPVGVVPDASPVLSPTLTSLQVSPFLVGSPSPTNSPFVKQSERKRGVREASTSERLDDDIHINVIHSLQCWLRSTLDYLFTKRNKALAAVEATQSYLTSTTTPTPHLAIDDSTLLAKWPSSSILFQCGPLTITRARHPRFGEWQCDTLLRYASSMLAASSSATTTAASASSPPTVPSSESAVIEQSADNVSSPSSSSSINDNNVDADDIDDNGGMPMLTSPSTDSNGDDTVRHEKWQRKRDRQENRKQNQHRTRDHVSVAAQEQADQWCRDMIGNMYHLNGSDAWSSLINVTHRNGYLNFQLRPQVRSSLSVSTLPSHPISTKGAACHCGGVTPPTSMITSNHKKKDLADMFSFQSIGNIESIYRDKHGTPRQGSIAPMSRARLILTHASGAPYSLEGLHEYSHVWLIFVFHANTNHGMVMSPSTRWLHH
jgi:hypothetical protein